METLRSLSPRTRADGSARSCVGVDWDLLVIGGPAWCAGLARVAHALAHEEVLATEGDILWRQLRARDEGTGALQVPVRLIPPRNSNRPVHIDAEMEALVARAIHQNFVPVVDDRAVFIGIVRREHILQYFADRSGGTAHPEVSQARSPGVTLLLGPSGSLAGAPALGQSWTSRPRLPRRGGLVVDARHRGGWESSIVARLAFFDAHGEHLPCPIKLLTRKK